MKNAKCTHEFKKGVVIERDYSEEKSTTLSPFHGKPVLSSCKKCVKCGVSICKK